MKKKKLIKSLIVYIFFISSIFCIELKGKSSKTLASYAVSIFSERLREIGQKTTDIFDNKLPGEFLMFTAMDSKNNYSQSLSLYFEKQDEFQKNLKWVTKYSIGRYLNKNYAEFFVSSTVFPGSTSIGSYNSQLFFLQPVVSVIIAKNNSYIPEKILYFNAPLLNQCIAINFGIIIFDLFLLRIPVVNLPLFRISMIYLGTDFEGTYTNLATLIDNFRLQFHVNLCCLIMLPIIFAKKDVVLKKHKQLINGITIASAMAMPQVAL